MTHLLNQEGHERSMASLKIIS